MFTPLSNSTQPGQLFCIMPVCFHPTTVMLVDDDFDFLKQLAYQLSGKMPVVTFTDPDEAIHYFENKNLRPFRERVTPNTDGLISAIRNEIYNPERFRESVISVIDYEMPNKTGFDIMNTMGKALSSTMSFHSYVLLTGKRYNELDKTLANRSEGQDFISKWDPDRVNQLLSCIDKKSAHIFQWSAYDFATALRHNPVEKTNFLFDGNFLPLLNNHIKEHSICELYLFDKQGSYLFLDENANLSWLFVRNQQAMVNTISLAKQYHAPQKVIDAISSKKMILSLYEKEDFAKRTTIDWDKYLLPASVFDSDNSYIESFKPEPRTEYYYAFTDIFPEHGIRTEKILSFKEFLQG